MKKILLTLLFAPIFAIATFAQAPTDLVITEIYYNTPGPGLDSLEFVEIHNPSTAAVNLKDYTFRTAIIDTFPNVSIAAGGYYTVTFNAKFFKKSFGIDAGHQWKTTSGNNALNNTGERIDLYNADDTNIVNAFKAIKVDEQHSQVLFSALGARNVVVQRFFEKLAVWQAG